MATKLYTKFTDIEKELSSLLFERTAPIRGMILATLSGTNILLLGPAGTGKSALINQWNARITDSKYFYWLLTKYSTPEEVFGPPSLKGLEEEKYYRVTQGKLTESNTVCLDEIFKANSSILNSMLTILNERTFNNDGKVIHLKDLITIAGASNEVPEEDDGLAAFFDRFLLKFMVKPIQESANFAKMLAAGSFPAPVHTVTLDEIKQAQKECTQIVLPDNVIHYLVKLRETLRKEGMLVTDRSFNTALRIIKADAWLNGQSEANTGNLEVLKHICWSKPEQEKQAHSMILEMIAPEKNKIMALYSESQDMMKAIYKHKDASKKQTAMIEANQKIKANRAEISRLKKDMQNKKQDVTEIDAIEKELETSIIKMAKEALGIDLTAYKV